MKRGRGKYCLTSWDCQQPIISVENSHFELLPSLVLWSYVLLPLVSLQVSKRHQKWDRNLDVHSKTSVLKLMRSTERRSATGSNGNKKPFAFLLQEEKPWSLKNVLPLLSFIPLFFPLLFFVPFLCGRPSGHKAECCSKGQEFKENS